MTSQAEIRSSIKFCALLGFTPTQTEKKISTAYTNRSVSRALVFRWHKRFREGRDSVEDDERSGRPNSAVCKKTVVEVQRQINGDRRMSIDEIIREVPFHISYGSVQTILTDTLKMRRV